MPTAAKPRRSRIRIGLDAIITTLCILGISWYFVIGPIFSIVNNIPMLLIADYYPFWDILLILVILLLIYQRTKPILYSSLLFCGLCFFSQLWSDVDFALSISL